jgi:D-glycero-D-manno-heptose 1,7-bisphosphate phosphatase
MSKLRRPAVFLDRDGVIIANRPAYVRCWADVEIFPQAVQALRQLAQLPFAVILVTNQSVVGRGIISQTAAETIHARVVEHFEQAGGRIDGSYLCLHAPEDGCTCRKPLPGLLLQAARELEIDLARSIMVGDALTDLAAGRAAGVAALNLVRTGRGGAQLELPEAAAHQPFEVMDDLLSVVDVLQREKNMGTDQH